ncbi:hypothetical protein SUGI_0042430 [Cryptomeria japonica]|nr:hypothetical protein SUGI_0042430 [Cryptomeria japonica]
MNYVLVSGGVVSGLGKGVTASSIGVILKACGLRVTSIKIDPYLNTDAGTMSPFEHGEEENKQSEKANMLVDGLKPPALSAS